ncbi:uncharacterized protein MELLADRAFT_106892 [Melampsora larici-populina 98AG31]|uniref:Secreted protein n=1 Tax=Melampsora larici-populina (strain 98AG31 / pathotype 3-4-7) TaxID=747676 RepID=F4RMZ6_MELLP|nr:uncharacterized protein MELLADRAFT_106892 [Melampsora larici-populina 98AG31]EGG06207.1 secreted protein [Melampsora larici-populina 98AG31]
MKLSVHMLGSALAVFQAFLTLAMERNLEEKVKLLGEPGSSQLSRIAEKISYGLQTARGSKQSADNKEYLPPKMQSLGGTETRLTPGHLTIKYSNPLQNLIQSSEMRHLVPDAKGIILKSPSPTHSLFTNEMEHYFKTVNTALNIWEKADLWKKPDESTIEKFRILGLLTELLRAVPWKPEAKEKLMQKWPDRLKLELKATDAYLPIVLEYAEIMTIYLLKYAYYETQEELPSWSDVRECFVRARLIGKHQKRVMDEAPGKAEKFINLIIKKYLMEPRLPQDENTIEELIEKLRSNLREIPSDTYEGKFLIELLLHLFQNPSAVQTRLRELEKETKFWKDVALPHARTSLDALLKENVQSVFLKEEIARVKKFKTPPAYENLQSIVKNMQSLTDSGDYKSAIQIYKILNIDSLYHSGVDKKLYKLLFACAHVPDYMAKLWSNMHPELTVAKNMKYETYDMMIKENPEYFLDAKRHILAHEMLKVECEEFSRLGEALNSLTVKPHQDIKKDSFERICQKVLDSIESTTIDDDDIPKRYAMSIETILRVLEYEPQSINYLIEYMDHDDHFRERLYLCAKHLIKLRHLIHKAAPQMLGFVAQIVKSYEDIWPLRFPVHRLNVYFKLEEENPDKRAEKIKQAIEALKNVIMESDLF